MATRRRDYSRMLLHGRRGHLFGPDNVQETRLRENGEEKTPSVALVGHGQKRKLRFLSARRPWSLKKKKNKKYRRPLHNNIV